MGLVNALQESAEQEDVLTVLRKAKRVSVKLKRDDISEWLDCEQNGYPAPHELPPYRRISTTFWWDTNGYIPAGYGQLKSGMSQLKWAPKTTTPIREPIGVVASWLPRIGDGSGLETTVPPELSTQLRRLIRCGDPDVLNQIIFRAILNEFEIRNIPEQVKNTVLDWALALEAKGVKGDEQSFSEKEQKIAQTVIFNISHSTIDQLNNAGTNRKGA